MGMSTLLGVERIGSLELLSPPLSDGGGGGGGASPEIMFLSNIDQVVLYPIETVYFYDVSLDPDTAASVAPTLRHALLRLLVPYYFMAGRLRLNRRLCRLELVCNNAGVLFSSASASVTLSEVGDPTFPNAEFRHLVLQAHSPTGSLSDLPLTTVQVTTFKCGGFTVGFSSNHALLDGIAAGEFLANFAALARGAGMQTHPRPDRRMLGARQPPMVEFEHFEYTWLPGVPFSKQKDPAASYTEADALVAATSRGRALRDYEYSCLHVDGEVVGRLKAAAGAAGATTFEALSAHLWQCRTAALAAAAAEEEAEEYTRFLFAVDFRRKMRPELPAGFAGNAVLCACARARAAELVAAPLEYAVAKVKEAREIITEKYVRSAIDCLEVNKGVPLDNTTCYVSAWWKIIRLQSLDFGWGTPSCAGPILSEMVEFILFVSDGTSDGLNVLLALPPLALSKFRSIFLRPAPDGSFFPFSSSSSSSSQAAASSS